MTAVRGARPALAAVLWMSGAAIAAIPAPPANGMQLQLTQKLARPGLPGTPRAPTSPAAAPSEGIARLLAEPQRCSQMTAAAPTAPLAIADVLGAVICQNSLVRRGAGVELQAQAALDRARAQQQPALNLSTGADISSRSSNAWSAVLRLDWVLYDFGSRDAGLRQARSALAGALSAQRAEVLTAMAGAAQLFAEAQASFGRLEAAALNLRTAEQSARMAVARQGAGAATLAEKLQAQTALAQARLEHSRGRSQWLSSRGALALAMGLRVSQAIEIAPGEVNDGAIEPQALDIAALIEEARDLHPRIAVARSQLFEARETAAIARADRWGRVGLNAQTGRSRASSDDGIALSTTATLGWTLPLFDRAVNASRLRDAQGQIQQRSVGVEDALKLVELQVWQQGQALISEREGLRESRLVLDSAEHSLRVTSGRYRQGVGNFTDVLTAQNVVANARFQLVEAQANLRRAELLLAAAVGRFGIL